MSSIPPSPSQDLRPVAPGHFMGKQTTLKQRNSGLAIKHGKTHSISAQERPYKVVLGIPHLLQKPSAQTLRSALNGLGVE